LGGGEKGKKRSLICSKRKDHGEEKRYKKKEMVVIVFSEKRCRNGETGEEKIFNGQIPNSNTHQGSAGAGEKKDDFGNTCRAT